MSVERTWQRGVAHRASVALLAWLVAVGCERSAPPATATKVEPGDAAAPVNVGASARTLVGDDVPEHRVGMFYVVWHTPAAHAMKQIAAQGGVQRTLEDLLRSGGAFSYSDVYKNQGVEAQAAAFYWSVRPQRGFYCLYRARTGEAGIAPDCDGIAETAAAHAEALLAAGVDHVIVDATNLTDLGPASDLLQLRPAEVLFEEWAKLRAAGKKTPQIALWAAIPTGATHWTKHVSLYENPAYEGLLLRDRKTKKKVYFVVDPDAVDEESKKRVPSADIMASLRAADLVVQRMWTLGTTDASRDRWSFLAPCRAGDKDITTILGDEPCDQAHTPASTLGSAVAVAPSYQVNFGSLPYAASGRFRGHTFRKQWATALSVMPEYVFVSGWNEFVSAPQANPIAGDPFAKSMGLERDPEGRNLFVDTFGAEFGRDIEPTVEYGSEVYDLMTSCARVFHRNAATGARGCNDVAETCCAKQPADTYRTVLAARNDVLEDVVLSTSRSELTTLLGAGHREVCSRHGAPSTFCLRGDEPSTPLGPFIAFGSGGAGRRALHRCIIGNRHFYSLAAGCEGQVFDGTLAFLQEAPSSEMPRRLQRCFHPTTGEHTVALGFDCPAGFTTVETLGYVR